MTTLSAPHPPHLMCDICGDGVAFEDAFVQASYGEIGAHQRGERPEPARWKIAHMNCPDPDPGDLYYLRAPDLFAEPPHNAIDHVCQKVWIDNTEGLDVVAMRLALCKPQD